MRGLVTPRPVQRLVDELSRLPGIGPKSASRLTYFMLRAPEEQSRALADALLDLKAGTRLCSSCYNITAAEVDPCFICASAERDAGVLCVVEDPLDVAALERTRVFNGHYHVLHGAISPIDGVGPDDLRIRELIDRVRRGSVREHFQRARHHRPAAEIGERVCRIVQPAGGRGRHCTRGR